MKEIKQTLKEVAAETIPVIMLAQFKRDLLNVLEIMKIPDSQNERNRINNDLT